MRVVVAVVALGLASCSATPTVNEADTTTSTTTTAIRYCGSDVFDDVGCVSTTKLTVLDLPTTTFAPLVTSPFSNDEIDFLNALVAVGLHGFIGAGWRTKFHHEGVDRHGIGRIDQGWHELDVLESYLNVVYLGHLLCNQDRQEAFLEGHYGEERQARQDFIVVARAWLC